MDKNPNIMTYPDIVGHAFGNKGTCLELYFVCIGLLILEEDNLHKLWPNFASKIGSLHLDGRLSFLILAGITIWHSLLLSNFGG